MKKQTKEKLNKATKASAKPKNIRRVIVMTLLAVFIVAQLLFDTVLVFRHLTSFPESEPAIATTLFNAIDSLNTPVPIEAETGKQYIANARLVVPASDITDMLYAYTPSDEVTLAAISFTTRQIISHGEAQTAGAYYDSFAKNAFSFDRQGKAFEALFTKLPSLQACARGVQIFQAAQPDDSMLVDRGEKKLQDGRTLHFYTEEQCEQQDQLNNLLEVVKQIESY